MRESSHWMSRRQRLLNVTGTKGFNDGSVIEGQTGYK